LRFGLNWVGNIICHASSEVAEPRFDASGCIDDDAERSRYPALGVELPYVASKLGALALETVAIAVRLRPRRSAEACLGRGRLPELKQAPATNCESSGAGACFIRVLRRRGSGATPNGAYTLMFRKPVPWGGTRQGSSALN